MSKYAFINMPAHGHVNYTLPIVQELVTRGQQVIYYLTDEFKHMVETAGASFHAYTVANNGPRITQMSHILQVMESLCRERPDFIVYDYMSGWASLLARTLAIPAISIRCTFAMNEHFSWNDMNRYSSATWSKQYPHISAPEVEEALKKQIEYICQNLSVPIADRPKAPLDMYAFREALNISFIPRCFQPQAETFDESYIFVGPSILPRPYQGNFSFDMLDERPLLYITLGTLFNNRTDIFKNCIKAFGNTPWQVIISRGQKNVRAALGPIPVNITVANYVPQLEIIPRASVFISHAGISSVVETLYYGIPMIAIPQIAEHAVAADRVNELGLGIAVNPDTVTTDQLRDAVERIINDQNYYQRCREMQQMLHEAGGYRRAVDAMLQLTH